jgi:hypothetical protein
VVGKLREGENSCPSSGEAAVAHPVAVGKLRETLVVGMFPTEHFLGLLSFVSGAVVGAMSIQGSAPLSMQTQVWFEGRTLVSLSWRGVARTAPDFRFLVDLYFFNLKLAGLGRQDSS